MEIKNSTVTFWFKKDLKIVDDCEILNRKLNEYFSDFSTTTILPNTDPLVPRLIASSTYSNVEISLISARLNINFDEMDYSDSNTCIQYIKERMEKLFVALLECGLSIVYSAIFINLEEKQENPIQMIKHKFLKSSNIDNMEELGIRFSQKIEDKFYKCVSINSGKEVKLTKIVDKENEEIIVPLVSLSDTEVENYLVESIELNDRLSFNLDRNYYTNLENLERMIEIIQEQIELELYSFQE